MEKLMRYPNVLVWRTLPIIAARWSLKEVKKNSLRRIVFGEEESESWKLAQLKDPVLSIFYRGKEADSHPLRQELALKDPSMKVYWTQWDSLVLKDGILCRRWESPDLRSVIFQALIPQRIFSEF